MANLHFTEAFARYGAKPVNVQWAADLTGRLVEFDGDRFVIDFQRTS